MKNTPATLQRLMNQVTQGMENCVAYIDDVIVFTDTWEKHVKELKELLKRLSKANLVVNLKKYDFVCAKVQYLGHVVGHGKVEGGSHQELFTPWEPLGTPKVPWVYWILPEVLEKLCNHSNTLD